MLLCSFHNFFCTRGYLGFSASSHANHPTKTGDVISICLYPCVCVSACVCVCLCVSQPGSLFALEPTVVQQYILVSNNCQRQSTLLWSQFRLAATSSYWSAVLPRYGKQGKKRRSTAVWRVYSTFISHLKWDWSSIKDSLSLIFWDSKCKNEITRN